MKLNQWTSLFVMSVLFFVNSAHAESIQSYLARVSVKLSDVYKLQNQYAKIQPTAANATKRKEDLAQKIKKAMKDAGSSMANLVAEHIASSQSELESEIYH